MKTISSSLKNGAHPAVTEHPNEFAKLAGRKIFVTGANGYLGRAVVALAADAGCIIEGVGLGKWPNGVEQPDGFNFSEGPLEDANFIAENLDGCDAVIHTAAMHLQNGVHSSIADYIRVNVANTAQLLEIGLNAGVRNFALSSSMTVQTGVDFLGAGMGAVNEEDDVWSNHPYPFSKLLLEEAAKQYSKNYDASIACLRFTAFGHEMKWWGPRLLARFLSAKDAARACLASIQVDGLRGEIFNISSGTELTNQQIHTGTLDPVGALDKYWPGASVICDTFDRQVEADDFWPVVSVKKAKRLLNWKPIDTFEAWLRQNGWNPSSR